MIDKNSVTYMEGYLKHALEFEKYVYIWSRAMDQANKRMSQLYSERRQLDAAKEQADSRLSSLDGASDRQQLNNEKEAARYKEKAKKSLTTTILLLILLFILGCGMGYVFESDPEINLAVSGSTFVLVMGVGVMVIGALFGVVPIGLGSYKMNKNKAESLEKEATSQANNQFIKRQEMMWQTKKREAENDWIVNVAEESVLSERQEEIHNALITAKKNLQQIYSENILPEEYRNMNAVATMYEYLRTGRCNTVRGHGGIFDTYKTELLHIKQLEQMIQMNETLSRIEDHQRFICQEMEKANQTLADIHSNLSEIEKTNAQIAKNTAISAEANRQTAAATQWLAWKAWANGY